MCRMLDLVEVDSSAVVPELSSKWQAALGDSAMARQEPAGTEAFALSG